jgi:hypothetical protein
MANFQNIVGKRLGQAEITTSFKTVYTAPVDARAYIKDIDICNTTSGTITVCVCLVPYTSTNTVGTAGTANALMYNMSIPANTTIQWTGSQIINGPVAGTNAGDTVQVKASATGCTVTISGGEAV